MISSCLVLQLFSHAEQAGDSAACETQENTRNFLALARFQAEVLVFYSHHYLNIIVRIIRIRHHHYIMLLREPKRTHDLKNFRIVLEVWHQQFEVETVPQGRHDNLPVASETSVATNLSAVPSCVTAQP